RHERKRVKWVMREARMSLFMSIDISSRNEARLRATARAEGVSIDDYLERLLNEREELSVVIEQASVHLPPLSREDACARIERGFVQSENGEVIDGDAFS